MMLPQPPPNAPAPPPSEAALRSQRWMIGIVSVGLLSLAILVLVATMPKRRGPDFRSDAVRNARQLGLALFEFEMEYGKFPDATTMAEVKKRTSTLLPLGTTTSNDYFRQIIAAELTDEERMFYARINKDSIRPDDVITGTEALKAGECGFSYLAGMSSGGTSARPIAVTPLIPGTDRFDPKPFDGTAIILRMDNSVSSLPIQKNGHVIENGMNLLDPANPIWAGETFTIAWPE